MKNSGLAPEGFFFPLFEELSFNVSPMALHPRFTLKMFSKSPVLDKHEDLIPSSDRYCWELFDKLTELFTYEYHYLMTYHLENIVNKRDWIKNFILLITVNKDRFVSQCGLEKYTFLLEMVTAHYSAFNNVFMANLSNSCEECRNRIITNIKHDVEFIQHLDGPERMYFCKVLKIDYLKFAKFWNFKLDTSELEIFNAENDKIDNRNQLNEGLKEESAKKDFKDLSGLKKIKAFCTTDFCAKKFGEFLATCQDENGTYVFNFHNTTVSEWMPRVFEFPFEKNIGPGAFRDKMHSMTDYKNLRNKPGTKR